MDYVPLLVGVGTASPIRKTAQNAVKVINNIVIELYYTRIINVELISE